MGYNRAVKTDAGNELLSRVIAGETTITFTKIATSEKGIDEFEIKQEMSASATKFVKDEKVGVILDTVFSNTTLVEGYDINVIGVYAKDSDDNEIMFSYLTADDTPTYMEAFNGQVPQNVHIKIEAGIWLDDGSMIVIDQSGIATIEYVDNKVEIINERIERLEDKLKSSIIVTIPDSTGNYIEHTDTDNNTYYTIDINVTGMTSDYVGTNAVDYVRPNPYSVDGNSAKLSLFSLITDIESLEGKIRVYVNEIPEESFQIYLYGV